ncbi:MAG: thiamine pyrophosphate-dependent enzyme [Bacteroidota bacterium]|nr:thiamine pyrophosphate-dependent enzyme [Bacteroidota bacterium]
MKKNNNTLSVLNTLPGVSNNPINIAKDKTLISSPVKDSTRFPKDEVLADYRIAFESRQASILGRREVLSGRGKFGIFGDGKEVPQLAMARVFRPGDWRSGYYRDQTFMLAAGMLTLEEFFAQVYGDTDPDFNPQTSGRVMNNHFATRIIDDEGNWKRLNDMKISAADLSPTAGQMPKLTGLALASKLYRLHPDLAVPNQFSNQGNEVAFGTIGDASTSEGPFWETINAAGVLQVPLAISVWDDGYGISVPARLQTTKQNISTLLKGFAREQEGGQGYEIYEIKGWDYASCRLTYDDAIQICRRDHVPVLIHVSELTQPLGHSTSGSHERYKDKERLEWEKKYDCISQMKTWMLEVRYATPEELAIIEKEALVRVRLARKTAWEHFINPLRKKRDDLVRIIDAANCICDKTEEVEKIKQKLLRLDDPILKDTISAARKILRLICNRCNNSASQFKTELKYWLEKEMIKGEKSYGSHLKSESVHSALNVKEIKPVYSADVRLVPGREILRDNFDFIFEHRPEVVMFGEDVGLIGGVNQTLEGLQKKYGDHRIFDTGIRETTIIGQGIGLAMRGFRPIAEIQYFDYIMYGLQTICDDLSTLHYRSRGGQRAPLIISTRGHRLEGIWHSGSPLSMVINSIRGVHVLVPRDMTRAAGFYNTMLVSDEPALIIEPLNGYRLYEKQPSNIGEFRVPLGVPEVLCEGTDVTLVTYGSCVRIAHEAVNQLKEAGISVELIDVQSLLPFDIHQTIRASLKKTNKIVFFDEDVPGGATAYMMQKVLEEHQGYFFLDASPRTITARDHRAAYSTDGDYFSNPNAEDVFDTIYSLMNEYNPARYPKIF